MHPALLIDEILQLILEVVLNDDKTSLCSAARCCQAWKDPALDRIWRRLPSAVPLLSLLPGFSMQNNTIRLGPITQDMSRSPFHAYAIRVKHIVHCHRVLADLANIPMHLFHQLSNLESACIQSRAAREVAALYMSLTPRVRALTLQAAYSKPNPASMTVYDMLSLLKGSTSLEQLSVRGHSSNCLHMPLSHLTTLCSLSLHLSSLTEQSFMTVSTFPLLVDFDVHANCLSCDFLSVAIAHARDAPFFPALEKLRIRAEPALVALVLRQMPQSKLYSLYVDATGPGLSSTFDGLFEAMAALPLRELTLEHVLPADESEALTYMPDRFFTLDHFRPLSKLPLKCVVIDSSLPLDLSDPAIEEMTTWWPRLQRLELGARTALESVGTSWKPRTSLASLCALARGCKHLTSLVITLDADVCLLPDLGLAPLGPHPLTSLSISSRAQPDVASLSTMLSRLFPSLIDVTPGFVGEHEDAWRAVQATISNTVHGNS